MALDAVLQMKELDKPFSEKSTMDDDVSEGSLEPLLLSDTEQSDKKEDESFDNEDEILNNELEKLSDEKLADYSKSQIDKTDSSVEAEAIEEVEAESNEKVEESESENITDVTNVGNVSNADNVTNASNVSQVTEVTDISEVAEVSDATNASKVANESNDAETDAKRPESVVETKCNDADNVKEDTTVAVGEAEKDTKVAKENGTNEEDLLQVMQVQPDEDVSENKENIEDDSKTSEDTPPLLSENSEKPNSPEELAMDIDETNEKLEEASKEIDIDDSATPEEEVSMKEKKRLSSSSSISSEESAAKKKKPNEPEEVAKEFNIKKLRSLSDYMLKKSLRNLTRGDLEEFCLQKIVEVLSSRSENSELRHKLTVQNQIIEQSRKEMSQLAKQVRELNIVHNRVLNELVQFRRTDKYILPIKITRSVGLQACVLEKKLSCKVVPSNSVTPSITPAAVVQPLPPQQVTKTVTPTLIPLSKPITTPPKPANTALRQLPPLKPKDSPNQIKVHAPIMSNNVVGNKVTKAVLVSSTIKKKKTDVVDLTGDDEKGPVANATSNKVVAPVTTVTGSSNIIATTATQPNHTLPIVTQSGRPGQQRQLNGPLRTIATIQSQSPKAKHPAPLPPPPTIRDKRSARPLPPKPLLNLSKSPCGTGIILQWKMPPDLSKYEPIASYQLFAYQETNASPRTDNWGKIGDVKALALPMAVTLTQFTVGNRYYFAVRAVDFLERVGAFSDPCSISL